MGLSLLEPQLCAHFPSQESSAPRFPHTAQNKCPGGLPGTAPRARSEASPTCCWLSSFVLPPPASWLESSSWPPASRTCCSGAAEGTGCASASAAHRRGGAGLLPALSSWRLELFAQLLLAAGFVQPWDRAGGRRTGQGMAGGSFPAGRGEPGSAHLDFFLQNEQDIISHHHPLLQHLLGQQGLLPYRSSSALKAGAGIHPQLFNLPTHLPYLSPGCSQCAGTLAKGETKFMLQKALSRGGAPLCLWEIPYSFRSEPQNPARP